MIKVNLISKKGRAYKGKNWTKIIIYSLLGLVGAYFVSVSVYVVISMAVLRTQIKTVNSQSVAISTQMLSDNELLSRFVLTKMILTEIQNVNKEKFPYKAYLDQLLALLPSGSSLTSVNFASKGWIAITVTSTDIQSFKLLENVLLNSSTWKDSQYFSRAYIEGVIKTRSGSYTTNIQLELINING